MTVQGLGAGYENRGSGERRAAVPQGKPSCPVREKQDLKTENEGAASKAGDTDGRTGRDTRVRPLGGPQWLQGHDHQPVWRAPSPQTARGGGWGAGGGGGEPLTFWCAGRLQQRYGTSRGQAGGSRSPPGRCTGPPHAGPRPTGTAPAPTAAPRPAPAALNVRQLRTRPGAPAAPRATRRANTRHMLEPEPEPEPRPRRRRSVTSSARAQRRTAPRDTTALP